MDMIWHYDHFIHNNTRIMLRYLPNTFFCNYSVWICFP